VENKGGEPVLPRDSQCSITEEKLEESWELWRDVPFRGLINAYNPQGREKRTLTRKEERKSSISLLL